jgi:GT2 family glycosyltransferase
MAPLVSIIIPTCNRPDQLTRCLRALVAGTPGDLLRETGLILARDGEASLSTIQAEFAASFLSIKEAAGLHTGPGAARNRGASLATTPWILFVDDDCEPQPGWLTAYLKAIQSASDQPSSPVVFEGRTRCPQPLDSLLWEAPVNETGQHLPSCNFGIRRDIYLQMGGFDERYRVAFEDMEFRARLVALSLPMQFLPDALVHHDRRRIPCGSKLAARWESRVAFACDLGASGFDIAWKLPRHVFAVILSRWREAPFRLSHFTVLPNYLVEWLVFSLRFPGWIRKYIQEPRSEFWSHSDLPGPRPRDFGF